MFAGVCVFRWDIDCRESTVLGIMGTGGIGFALNEAILGLESVAPPGTPRAWT